MSQVGKVTEAKQVKVIGRIVWVSGDLFKGSHKRNYNTKQLEYDKAGKPVFEWGFGLAVHIQSIQNLWVAHESAVRELYPNGIIPRDFATKRKDGQKDLDKNNQPILNETDTAGQKYNADSFIYSCVTRIAPKFCKFDTTYDANNPVLTMIDQGIKCGDWVEVALTVKAQHSAKPGMYFNPNFVRLIQEGAVINKKITADQVFSNNVTLPPNAVQQQPVQQQGVQMPQMPSTPNFNVLPPQMQNQFQQQPVQQEGVQMPQMPSAPQQPMMQYDSSQVTSQGIPMPTFNVPK